MSASIEDVCIDHRRTDVLMPEQLLNCPNITPVFEQIGSEDGVIDSDGHGHSQKHLCRTLAALSPRGLRDNVVALP